MKRIVCLIVAISLLLTGCSLQSDPPMIRRLPKYDSRIVLDSGDFQDCLFYYEYSFESYSADDMKRYMENSVYFKPIDDSGIDKFRSIQFNFDSMLKFHALYGTAPELVDTYFDDEFHVTKSIPLDDEDWFCDSEYGVFVYDTQSQVLYGLNA